MKLDLNKYRKIKETIEYTKVRDEMLEKGDINYDKISMLSATASLNIIAIYSFLKEDVSQWEEFCNYKIKMLKEFYGYDEIC